MDDPRNTDNAWMETIAVSFHDDTGLILDSVHFKTGINARGLQWQEVSNHLKLQANHIPFLKRVAELHGALYD